MRITKEEFDDWKQNPITECISKIMSMRAEQLKEEWVQSSWVHGALKSELLADLRARAQAHEDFATLDWETVQKMMEIGNE